MDLQMWTWLLIAITFSLYIGIAIWSRAGSTKDFYVAGGGVSPIANGLATAADWMSAASFISMAGLISFSGYDASVYLMGWTGGYVLLALLLAPYLRKFGKFTVPDFIGDRYYSQSLRAVGAIFAILISIAYCVGQFGGIGLMFKWILGLNYGLSVIIGGAVVLTYTLISGMLGVTKNMQIQYVIIIVSFLIPLFIINFKFDYFWLLPQIQFNLNVRIVVDSGFAYGRFSGPQVDRPGITRRYTHPKQ